MGSFSEKLPSNSIKLKNHFQVWLQIVSDRSEPCVTITGKILLPRIGQSKQTHDLVLYLCRYYICKNDMFTNKKNIERESRDKALLQIRSLYNLFFPLNLYI